jgi:hypothetical protein
MQLRGKGSPPDAASAIAWATVSALPVEDAVEMACSSSNGMRGLRCCQHSHAVAACPCRLLDVRCYSTYLSDGGGVGIPQTGANALGHSFALGSAAATPGRHGTGRSRRDGTAHTVVLAEVATCGEWQSKQTC